MKTDDSSIGCFHLTGIAGQDGRQMSIEALTVVLHHSKAKHSAKLVLLGIANHYHPDDERGAWPSQDTLAKYANITDRGVRKCLDDLVALGELRVESHGGPTRGTHKPNRYWITLECPEDCDRSMNHRPKQPELSDEATGTIQQSNRNNLTEQPEPQFRLTVIEPKEEPKKNLKGRETHLPDDWYPSERLLDMFATKWPNLTPDYEIEQFILYWHSVNKKKANWDVTFQRWMNDQQQKATRRPATNYAPRMTNNQKAALLALEMRQEAEQRKALEAGTNTQQGKKLEGEVSSWMKGIDDV
jgi:hypothetical protein